MRQQSSSLPLLHRKKQGHQQAKELVQDHAASKWQDLNSDWGSSNAKSYSFSRNTKLLHQCSDFLWIGILLSDQWSPNSLNCPHVKKEEHENQDEGMFLESQSFSLKIFISNFFHIKAWNNRSLSWFSDRISGIKSVAYHWAPTEAGNGFLPCTHACSIASVVSDCVRPYGLLLPARLLRPWNSPGRNTGVGCCALLQGIFPTQGLDLHLLHCRWILHHWDTREARIPSSGASKFPISQKNHKRKENWQHHSGISLPTSNLSRRSPASTKENTMLAEVGLLSLVFNCTVGGFSGSVTHTITNEGSENISFDLPPLPWPS